MGGQPNVLLATHTILRQTPEGVVEFFWSGSDHFTLDDWLDRPPDYAQTTNTDLDHANSLEIDRDGNYVASFFNLPEITKIDAVTGRVIWRFSGRNNQFNVLNDPLGGVSGQHSVRVLENGNLLIYDNGKHHNPPESRPVEYSLDTVSMTASMVWEYRHAPVLFTPVVGSVERLRNGNTLVGFGAVGVATEVANDGSVAWEGHMNPPFFYRVRRISSLYRFEQP